MASIYTMLSEIQHLIPKHIWEDIDLSQSQLKRYSSLEQESTSTPGQEYTENIVRNLIQVVEIQAKRNSSLENDLSEAIDSSALWRAREEIQRKYNVNSEIDLDELVAYNTYLEEEIRSCHRQIANMRLSRCTVFDDAVLKEKLFASSTKSSRRDSNPETTNRPTKAVKADMQLNSSLTHPPSKNLNSSLHNDLNVSKSVYLRMQRISNAVNAVDDASSSD